MQSKSTGPGKYSTENKPLADKRKQISWNFGSVPFGTCIERFKDPTRLIVPGPGKYTTDLMCISKPLAQKPQSIEEIKKRHASTSPVLRRDYFHKTQKQEMLENQQSWAFKSKEPRNYMAREEARLRHLQGGRTGLKYKIKLNDEILEPGTGDSRTSPRGKIATGITVPDTEAIKAKKLQFGETGQREDIWGTSKASTLGPGQYDVS